MIAGFLVALIITISIRLSLGPRERMVAALRATARWSFVLYWLATVGGALKRLFGRRFEALARHARDLALSFASAHLVHLALVAWMFLVSVPDLGRQTVIVFSIGVFWTYLLAILSFPEVSRHLDERATRALRLIGVEYLTVAFFIDFNKDPFAGGIGRVAYYAPFVVLTVAGPVLRLAAALKRATQRPTLSSS
jgi:hypothetical protein